jgi:outer membrane protein TolC
MLTIEEAIDRGLKYNLGSVAAALRTQSAQASVTGARSALLPNVTGNLAENVDRISLAAQGFSSATLPSIGNYFPSAVGPFHYYSAQAQLSQSAFDLVATRNYLAAKEQGRSATLSARDAREQVVLAVAASYLEVLTQAARVQSAEAQVKSAQTIYDQAVRQRDAGAKSTIEVNRSRVELQRRQLQLLAQLGEIRKQKMALARLIGLAADREVLPVETLAGDVPELPAIDSLYHRSSERYDLKSIEAQLHAAEQSRKAAGAERLPSVRVSGFYGLQGPDFNSGSAVYNGSASLNIPVFNGGQTRSDIQQADAVVQQHRAEYSAKQEDVRVEVRAAWIDLDTVTKQFTVADSNRDLARQTLQQSADRFKVGAADSVELVQSQETLATAEQDYINSLYSIRLAQLNLARAVGAAEQDAPKILKGVQR